MAKPNNSAAAVKQKINTEKQRVMTPEFRVSYPHLFEANAVGNSDPKYSITMLFPKSTDLSEVKKALKEAKLNAYGSKENWPDDLLSPVSDGDNPKHANRDGYKGHWVVKASTRQGNKPGVVDQSGKIPITNPADLYAGCYARAIIFANPWEYMGKRGVSFILDHVQKIRDGKPFGGRKPAEQSFSPINDGDFGGDDDLDDLSDDDKDFI